MLPNFASEIMLRYSLLENRDTAVVSKWGTGNEFANLVLSLHKRVTQRFVYVLKTQRTRLRRRFTQMGTSHSRLWKISLPLSLPFLVFAYYRWRQRRLRKIEHYEQVGHVTGLFIYPVKSCAGISLETADCLTEGLQFDRFVCLFVCLFLCL